MGSGYGKTDEGQEEEKTGERGATAGTRSRRRHASYFR